jgi:hypothetical protein
LLLGENMELDTFARRKAVSTYWWNKSSDLRGSAAALWASMDVEASQVLAERFGLGVGFDMRAAAPLVFRMICGMSLELLYKAIIVSRGAKPKHDHELVALARAAGIRLEVADEALVRILTEAVKWDGRYPVPKERATWDELSAMEREHLWDRGRSVGRFVVARPNHKLSWDGFDRLWREAASQYEHP